MEKIKSKYQAKNEINEALEEQLDVFEDKLLETYQVDEITDELMAEKEALILREMEVLKKEKSAMKNFTTMMDESFLELRKDLESKQKKLLSEWQKLEQEKVKTNTLKLTLQKKEASFQSSQNDLREQLLADLERTKIEELAAHKIELKKEEQLRLDEAEKMIKIQEDAFNQQKASKLEEIEKERFALNDLKSKLEAEQMDLMSRSKLVDHKIKMVEVRQENQADEINQIIDERISDERNILKRRLQDANERNVQLLDDLKVSEDMVQAYESLKRRLGGKDAIEVLTTLRVHENTIKTLRDDLSNSVPSDTLQRFNELKMENEQLTEQVRILQEEKHVIKQSTYNSLDLQRTLQEKTDENDSNLRRLDFMTKENKIISSELSRIRLTYGQSAEYEERIKAIETPYFKVAIEKYLPETSEVKWLENIRNRCESYGLKFPKRILYAFHTALKTAEWSPLTVLAGVSGTGKSELPRLYSHFGGLNFINVSVQPNWDSQESMLGFFNSIDNKFDAQPLLNVLAQSQMDSEENPMGMSETVNIVLLDEMNLAHIELYFAEFLSKLEMRRGLTSEKLPNLDIKLGAGMPPYELPLGRNVLWAGTMNQDETTKSLSDKVLDRGIVINFPKPQKFHRRGSWEALPKKSDSLTFENWKKWQPREIKFSEEEFMPFKEFVEDINNALSSVGRALGHRVWQSIEYYMANYPDVIVAQNTENEPYMLERAMKIAFEDQLVQKVMPKLRGIETRGRDKTECLDKIRLLLDEGDYDILYDFDLACQFGYGQFIWSSANYLNIEEL